MGQVRCGKCGSVWDAADQDEGLEVKCPSCRETVVVSFRRGQAPQAPVARVAATEPVLIQYGIVPEHQIVGNKLSGNLTFAGGQITIVCTGTSAAAIGASQGGLIGGLIGGAISAVQAKKQPILTIDPAAGGAFIDEKRKLFSLPLSDGRWVAIKGVGFQRKVYPRLLGVMQAAYGQKLAPARLGRLPRSSVITLWVIFGLMAALLLFVGVMAFLESRSKKSQPDPYRYNTLPARTCPLAHADAARGGLASLARPVRPATTEPG